MAAEGPDVVTLARLAGLALPGPEIERALGGALDLLAALGPESSGPGSVGPEAAPASAPEPPACPWRDDVAVPWVGADPLPAHVPRDGRLVRVTAPR